VRLNESKLRIKFADTGYGMNATCQSEVFEPFSRLGQEISQVEGTGIGLAISKKLIKQLDGTFDFTSEPGLGSEFWIDVPTGSTKKIPALTTGNANPMNTNK
jgi:signal transduction histidine kinase